MCQKLRKYGTFWYFRHLWPLDLLGSLTGLIFSLNTLHWSTSKAFNENSNPLTLKLSDNCMSMVRATPGGHRKSFLVSRGVLECPRVTITEVSKCHMEFWEVLFWRISSDFLQLSQVTNRPIGIFQLIWRFPMPEISKCPIHTQLLACWEASGEVSVLS